MNYLKSQVTNTDELTLRTVVHGRDPEEGTVFSEAHPLLDHLRVVERTEPSLIDRFRLRETRRGILEQSLKLIQIGSESEELYDIESDSHEMSNLILEREPDTMRLSNKLDTYLSNGRQSSKLQRPASLEFDDESVLTRLRALGYVD
jgi:hypothetical protein